MARLRPYYLGTDWTKILKFNWWMVIDVDYRIAKKIDFLNNLVNLFTVQNRLELGPQLPRKNSLTLRPHVMKLCRLT